MSKQLEPRPRRSRRNRVPRPTDGSCTTRRAWLVLVVVLFAGLATACAGDRSDERQSAVPPDQVVDTPAIPDPAGAARVVRRWLLTIQNAGTTAACPLMTPGFQRQMPAFLCSNPNGMGSAPFMTVEYRAADVRVRSQDGDIAIVDVTFPDGERPPTTYSTRYDHSEKRWLVAGHLPDES